MPNNTKSLPVITYHNVNTTGAPLSIAPSAFESHCRRLTEEGWIGVGLNEAEAFFLEGKPLPQKSVLITLDDGYLDNYIYAWPILQKYGHKAVIFATTTYIDNAQKESEHLSRPPRHTLKDVWEKQIEEKALPPVDNIYYDSPTGKYVQHDFFSWDEARLMETSGTIAIGGHSLRHDGIFTSPHYDGFHHPKDSLIFLGQEASGHFWGRPCFTQGAFLAEQAFIPSETLLQALRDMVPQDDSEVLKFYANAGQERLQKFLQNFKENYGRMETIDEWRQRLHEEMHENQQVLTRELGHSVQSFCWPWGLSCPLAVEAGKAAGFNVFYDVTKGTNRPRKSIGIRRMDFRTNPEKLIARLGTYSHPLRGEAYEYVRKTTKFLTKTFSIGKKKQ